ncbi:hypothetical protein [Actinokineospora sp.]|uniref:hypothetical protein n=1 Tax=Actinokineospora sp. TaxID=1872133 RepID=UPI004037A344
MSAHQIYEALRGGAGTSSLATGYDIANAEAGLEAERAKLINRIAQKIEAGWQGQAGAAAFGAAKPIADVSIVGADNLERTHALLRDQADGFDSASGSVLPVPPSPPETGFLDDITPWSTDTESEIERYRQDSEHNIRVYGMYDDQSTANEQALPMDYSSLTDPGGAITVTGPDKPGLPPNPPGTGDPTDPPGTGVDSRDQPRTPPPNPPLPPDQPPFVPTDRPQPDRPQTTNPNDFVPTTPTTPPGTGRPPLVPLVPADPALAGGYPGGRGGAGGFGGGTGSGGGYGPGARPGEYGPGGRPGAAAGAEHGPGSRSGGAPGGEHGPGGRGAAAAAGRGAGGVGGAGMGGMGAGGGRGQGGEDSEHTRASFLQENDPEAIFGTDQITAPPVIGE